MSDCKNQERLNRAYKERNTSVILSALLAAELGYKSGWGKDGNESWDDEWRTVVYIDLPTGQVSWHMDPETSEIARSLLPLYKGKWNGTFASRESTYVEAYAVRP